MAGGAVARSGSVAVVLSGLVVGSMAATFALSIAAMIYAGPLASHLEQGIALTLLGAIIMGLIGAFIFSYRGTIVQPQDVTAILLALAAAGIATQHGLSSQAAFSTVVALIVMASFVTGGIAFVMGFFRLGYLVRYVPFPVVSGFLAASAWFSHRHRTGSSS
jgi:sulfate permease, SulP family